MSPNSIVPIGDGAAGGEGGNGNGGDNNTNNSSDSQVVASYDSRGKHIFVGNAKVRHLVEIDRFYLGQILLDSYN